MPRPVKLTEKQISDAFGRPMNEEEAMLAAQGKPTDSIAFPRRFKVTSCKDLDDRTVRCSFDVKWRRGGWHPKQGRFVKRADGVWIADETSRTALYEK
jgi:hypothetical protein